jgi:hypothetical protein
MDGMFCKTPSIEDSGSGANQRGTGQPVGRRRIFGRIAINIMH